MQNVCRTCMGDSVTLVNIFSDVRDPALEQPERNLSYILSECTNRSIRRDDRQPQFICLKCVQDAQTAFRFKRQCDRSYHRFCELQKNEDQDRDSKRERHKEVPITKDSQSDSSPARHDDTKKIPMKVCQKLDETERTQNINNVEGKRFACSHCPKDYKFKFSLTRHLLTHNSKPDHNCPYCSKVYWRKDTYINHLLHHHGIRTFVSCNQCPTICPDANQLEMHRREHNVAENLILPETVHKNLCDLCSDSFILEDDLRIHRILVHDVNETFGYDLESKTIEDLSIETSEDTPTSRQTESGFDQESISDEDTQSNSKFVKTNSKAKRFQCPTCKKWYKTEKYMEQHHQAIHVSKPKHRCPICPKAFCLRFKLTRHLRIHDQEGPYACRQCSAIFIDHNHFKLHQLEHEEKNVGGKFPIRRMLNCKIKDTNSRQIESGFDQDTTSSGQGENRKKRVECPVCQSTYKDTKGMRRHLKTHNAKPNYTCSICSKPFWRIDHHSRHLRTHKDNDVDLKYSCNICPAKFAKMYRLDRHKREVHESRKIIKCRYCSREYKSKKALRTHEARSHCA